MKICIVQTRPASGDVQKNIDAHLRLIDLAATHDADTVVFPELSLTGYEPTLAAGLAMTIDDARLAVLQEACDRKRLTACVGAPTHDTAGTGISMMILQANAEPRVYSKQYLHPDEEPYFVAGSNAVDFLDAEKKIALAICYELSVPAHAENAARNGAGIYIASVAKFRDGVERATERLAEIARAHSMTVFMANSVGGADGQKCAGQSAVWDAGGKLLGWLDGSREGILVFDTETRELVRQYA